MIYIILQSGDAVQTFDYFEVMSRLCYLLTILKKNQQYTVVYEMIMITFVNRTSYFSVIPTRVICSPDTPFFIYVQTCVPFLKLLITPCVLSGSPL